MTVFCSRCVSQDHASNMTKFDGYYLCKECSAPIKLATSSDVAISESPENDTKFEKTVDLVNNPSHYQGKGIECIQVIEAFELGFNLGNAIKYILRAEKKALKDTDLRKALWYINRELNLTNDKPE